MTDLEKVNDDKAASLAIAEVVTNEVTTPHTYAEGGIKAWLVVLGCWCTSFASFGIVNAWGVYQTYYADTFLRDYSPSTIAWIGSIQTFAEFLTTTVSGPLTDRYGATIVILPSSAVLFIAMMLTSLCQEYYQFLLCQGVLLGIATGAIFAPALTVVGHYFYKRRALAMSIASTGSPVGGIIYPVMLNTLLPHGFGWAQRVCGILTLGLLVVAAITVRPTSIRRQERFILLDAFTKPMYSLQVLAYFLIILCLWTPAFYLAVYAIDEGVAPTLANYLFATLNAGSLVGRVIGGIVAVYLGQFNILCAAAFTTAILFFCWLATTTSGGLVVLSAFFGASTGITIALLLSVLAHTAERPSQIGTYIGQANLILAFAGLAGPPISGALIQQYGYSQAIIFGGVVSIVGAFILIGARHLYVRNIESAIC